jgi:hypothetical protein
LDPLDEIASQYIRSRHKLLGHNDKHRLDEACIQAITGPTWNRVGNDIAKISNRFLQIKSVISKTAIPTELQSNTIINNQWLVLVKTRHDTKHFLDWIKPPCKSPQTGNHVD